MAKCIGYMLVKKIVEGKRFNNIKTTLDNIISNINDI